MRRRFRFRAARLRRFVIIPAAALLVWLLIYGRLATLAREMAVSAASNKVTSAVSRAVAKRMAEGELDYGDIITLEKNADGQVTALLTNMQTVNSLKAAIAADVIDAVTADGNTGISIPAGDLFNSHLLADKGPGIRARFILVNTVETDFANRFTSAGINQTHHEVLVTISVAIKVLIPGNAAETKVTTAIVVSDVLIVGKVPDSYTYFEGDDKWDENLERFDILN
ncbi:MAG: sporulation protein YunB [Oscillospiraceae bacterium]|jgi:sporulation protein YunB|nr:sporulation protein YunB [Oscillospiraceae bacterium]